MSPHLTYSLQPMVMLNIFKTCQALTQFRRFPERIYGLMTELYIKIY